MPARKVTSSKKQKIVSETLSNEPINVVITNTNVERTVEQMEKVKSKIESFDKVNQMNLLKTILVDFSRSNFYSEICESSITDEAFDDFRNQVTENQNGIFLNLTTCSDTLWQSCVQSVNSLEKQAIDLEKLDKERANEVALLKKSCRMPKKK